MGMTPSAAPADQPGKTRAPVGEFGRRLSLPETIMPFPWRATITWLIIIIVMVVALVLLGVIGRHSMPTHQVDAAPPPGASIPASR
jgi:hypothetical protein